MPPILKTDFNGDPNLGLHTTVTEDYCLIDPSLADSCYRKVKDTLNVEVIKTTAAGSRMVGIFCASNSNGVVVPKNIENNEIELIEDKGLKYRVINSKQTALGNLILVNDDICLIPKFLKNYSKGLEGCFGVPVEVAEIAGLDLLGTCGVVTNRGLLCHRDASEDEMTNLEGLFGLECGRGTVNFGMPLVGACVIANSKGALTGIDTTGPELGRIHEALLAQEE